MLKQTLCILRSDGNPFDSISYRIVRNFDHGWEQDSWYVLAQNTDKITDRTTCTNFENAVKMAQTHYSTGKWE